MGQMGEALTAALSILAALVTGGLAFRTYWQAANALRAKERLRRKVHEVTLKSEEFRHLARLAAQGKLNDQQTEKARQLLEQLGQNLSERDRDLIWQGLHQSSKSGENRYIEDLISDHQRVA